MSERSLGFEEYTPSRLEWLVVMLNSHVQYVNTIDERVDYLYTLRGDGNTIIMQMRHDTDLHPEVVKGLVDVGKNLAMTLAKRYKWDSWINIQTELNPIDRRIKE